MRLAVLALSFLLNACAGCVPKVGVKHDGWKITGGSVGVYCPADKYL